MLDSFGRCIDYIRLSITDRCNLRCRYCMPGGLAPLSHDDVLRYEEILRFCKIAVNIGIKTFKVTGGEPLVRKGCVGFLRDLKAIPGAENVTLTTNGILLERCVSDLAEMKLGGINISMDSLNPETYMEITGGDYFPVVLSAMHKAVEAGLVVKINCVPMRGVNDLEIVSIARLAEDMPIDIRFIEFMPTSADEHIRRFTGAEILDRLMEAYPDLEPTSRGTRGFGPARYFKSVKMQGRIGIIDAIESCFCSSCNRVRLTSSGFLKLCLFHSDGLNVQNMLRGGASDAEIENAIRSAIYNKPEWHLNSDIKNMSQIGG